MSANEVWTGAAPGPRRGEPKTRLMFADDNPGVLDQLCAMLKGRFEIVAALSSGEDVLRKYPALAPDVIILDISMGRMSGLDVAKLLREQGCKLPIIFLTVHTGADFVSTALACGGSGYVVKAHMRKDLPKALSAVMSGELFVSPCAS
ncbi:MAG: response regulator transcription factor [Actinomycetota bacterium]